MASEASLEGDSWSDENDEGNTRNNENDTQHHEGGLDMGVDVINSHGEGIGNNNCILHKPNGKSVVVEGDEGKEKVEQLRNYDIRVLKERESRRKMAKQFVDLHALLNLPPKVDKATIVQEAITSIKCLEETLHDLQKKKLEKSYGASAAASMTPFGSSQSRINNNIDKQCVATMNSDNTSFQSSNIFKSWKLSNVAISVCGADASIYICSSKKHGLFTVICFILAKHNLEIVTAQINSDHDKTMYLIHVRGNVPPEVAEEFIYEEMYKKAATQISRTLGFLTFET